MACTAVKALKFLPKARKTATLRLDEAPAGGITDFGEADNKLTVRGLATEGCSFLGHVTRVTRAALTPQGHRRACALGWK